MSKFNLTNPALFIACLFAFGLGAVGVLAYSPFDLSPLAFVSAAGLIWASQLPRKTALWATLAWSIGYFGIGVNWVHVSMIQFGGVPLFVSYLAVLLLAGYLGLYNLLFTFIRHRLNLHNPFVLASLFTFTEYLRGVVFTGFPWLQFGYSQIDTPFAGLAPLFGVEGLTFMVMVVSGYLVQCLTGGFRWQVLAGLAGVLALSTMTSFVDWQKNPENSPPQAGKPLKIALVQGNIEQKMKWDPAYFDETLKTYARLVLPQLGKQDLVILPESAIPALEDQIEPILQDLQKQAQAKGSELILGTLYRKPNGEMFNSAVKLGDPNLPYHPDGLRYNKHHLVPFGEYLPFGGLLDGLREVFILPINLSQGRFIQSAMNAKNQRFNLAICYEIIFGDQVQQNQLAQQSDYLLTITNDAWFGESIGPWQHFQMARMRALELGKPLLRAANTGITAVVDEKGKITAQLPQFSAEVLEAEISPSSFDTLFARAGNKLIYGLSLLIFALGLALNARRNPAK